MVPDRCVLTNTASSWAKVPQAPTPDEVGRRNCTCVAACCACACCLRWEGQPTDCSRSPAIQQPLIHPACSFCFLFLFLSGTSALKSGSENARTHARTHTHAHTHTHPCPLVRPSSSPCSRMKHKRNTPAVRLCQSLFHSGQVGIGKLFVFVSTNTHTRKQQQVQHQTSTTISSQCFTAHKKAKTRKKKKKKTTKHRDKGGRVPMK